MKSTILCLFFFSYYFALTASPLKGVEKDNCHIALQVKKGANLYISYPVSLVKFKEVNITNASKDTLVQVSFYTDLPCIIFNTNKTQTPHLVFPNTSYEGQVERNQTKLNLKCKDRDKEFESMALDRIQDSTGNLYTDTNLKVKGLRDLTTTYNKALDDFLIDLNKRRLKILKHYFEQHKLSTSGYQYLNFYLKFDLINGRLMPFYSRKLANGTLPDWYRDSLNQYNYSNQDSIYLRLYTFQRSVIYLNYFRSLRHYKNTSTSSLIQTAAELPDGNIKDFLIYQTLNTAKEKTDQSYRTQLQNVKFSARNYYLQEILQQQIQDISFRKALSADQFYTTTNTPFNFDQLFPAKDKVYYVDFWASWCVPCLEEMTYSKMLHDKVRNTNIVMVYISIDQNLTAWKDKNKELGLPEQSYVTPNFLKSKLAVSLGLSTIPRYIIVKGGNIVNKDAKAPSDRTLLAELKLYSN